MHTSFCYYCFFCPISIFLHTLNSTLYFVLFRTEDDRRTVETCFLILKVAFIFLNSWHICFYPELYLPGLRITKSVFGDELSFFTKPQLINSISNNCAAFVQVSETIIIGGEAAFVGSVVFDLFNRRLKLFCCLDLIILQISLRYRYLRKQRASENFKDHRREVPVMLLICH